MSSYVTLDAVVVAPEALKVSRARSLLSALQSEELPYVKFVSAVRFENGPEGIILDAMVELGQEPPVPIKRCERIGVVLSDADDSYPEVYALRDDFPQVPHLNCREEEFPKSLCLYEEPWVEVKLRWTPSGFIERIRNWLALTAEGRLHGDDQPLEPILIGRYWRLVLPSDVFSAAPTAAPERLIVGRTTDDKTFNVLVAVRPDAANEAQSEFVATTFHAEPQQHGVIRRRPRSVADLDALMRPAGVDFLGELRKRLRDWGINAAFRKAHLIVVAYFPKTRTGSGAVETRDIWAFMIEGRLEEIGKKLGLWELSNGHIAPLLSPDLSKRGDEVQVDVLNTSFALSRDSAASLNSVLPKATSITAIGAGALGSQVVPKLVQSGFGVWTIIDDDHLLPHNVARHQFSNAWLGQPKAEALAIFCDSFLEGKGTAKGIVANVLAPGAKAADVNESLRTADAIIDFSASVAVGRFLARHAEASCRRLSVFLNPTGSDLVVLAEDANRSAPLDYLEMIYYAEVGSKPQLATHLERGAQRFRYARSCRDLTSTVPEDLVGLHSAIASRAIREALSREGPTIRVWRAGAALVNQADFAGTTVRYFYHPYLQFTDMNNLSIVAFVRYADFCMVLPGDIERAGWLAHLQNPEFRQNLSAVNVFVASHHGRENGYCKEVFQYCRPELVVISDTAIQHETQDHTYDRHAKGLEFSRDGRRYVLTARCDGHITIDKTNGQPYTISTQR